ncbi:MAG: HNH endonuclease signature motif containing protein [Flavipsychrobacter sp.]
MTKEDYYKISRDQKLPLRCPCLNNCVRYRDTAYFIGVTCYKPRAHSVEEAMLEMGILGHDEDISKMLNAGEPVTMIGGSRSFWISNGCPEFFLHPHQHKLVEMKDLAVHQYSYDKEYKTEKCRPGESRHYTECAEYSLFTSKKVRTSSNRKKVSPKVKAILQKEINSQCPICFDDNVEHFEIHHIDEDRTNNEERNLLMVCRNCHSKFTKGDISIDQAKEIKTNLKKDTFNIQCLSVNIDSSSCSWKRYDEPNAFYDDNNEKSRYPILQFSVVNNSKQTVLLTGIELKSKKLPSGISGIPKPYELKSLATYKILLPSGQDISKYSLENELVLYKESAAKFSIEPYLQICGKKYPPNGRMILYFTFIFNNNIRVPVSDIFLNCKDDNESFTIAIIS